MNQHPTRAVLIALLTAAMLLSGCSGVFDIGTRTATPTTTDPDRPVGQSATPTPGATTSTIASTETEEKGVDPTQTITTTAGRPSESTANLQQVVLQRRDLSADYVQFGELSRVDEELSATKKNNSVTEWHRRTFRLNRSVDQPLLVTSSVRRYESDRAATAALDGEVSNPEALNATVKRIQLSGGLEVTVVRFRPESGTYGVTVLYQTDQVLLRLDALDPDRFHKEQAESYLLKMIGYLRTSPEGR